ncbi:MAG: SDR family oxidoreductase [Aquificaceae bacterium]|nr:SDR family oxidoreductase [Aquificaceae bacterium]MDW8095586.1 SDR family oxidoreductase [Aquificaceae bacterium]
MKYVLILGAKSDIAKAIARVYAEEGYNLCLAGRNIGELETFAKDLEIRFGIETRLFEFDATAFELHHAFYQALEPKPYGVVYSAGYMTDQKICEQDWKEAMNTMVVNYVGAVSILNIIAQDFEKRGYGFIIGISSVAGDRGRASNYIYGSAKAGFSAYLSGLRGRLHRAGVQVITVKPGFVKTKMTRGMKLPPLLTALPEEVAREVIKAQKKGIDMVYVRGVWKYIMFVVKHLPEFIFKRLNF